MAVQDPARPPAVLQPGFILFRIAESDLGSEVGIGM